MANDENREEEKKKRLSPNSVPEPESAAAGEECVIEATVGKVETVDAEPLPGDATTALAEPLMMPEKAEGSEVERDDEEPGMVRAAYEHPTAIRITHWVNAISLFVLVTSGLRIFRAFPSFGPKIPEKILIDVPKSLTLGGWLGGALQWHFTFMWFFAASGIFYVVYQIASGHYRTLLFTPRDVAGVWPMARHYFFFGPKPLQTGQYNALQKLAYTSAIGFGALSLLTGIVLV